MLKIRLSALCLLTMLCLPLRAQMEHHTGVPDGMVPEGGPKVLIIYEKTDFKMLLVGEMEKMLKMSGVDVTMAEHGEDTDIEQNPADYEAIFITNSGVRSMIRPWIVSWLKKHKDQAGKIILHTTQRNDWEVKPPTDVDAVTSASAPAEVRNLTIQYCGLVMRHLMPAPPPAE